MKKTFILILVLLSSFLSYTFADIKDSFFCTIWSDVVTVTLNKQNNYKCSIYLISLSQAIKKEYDNVLEIQKLIDQWYSVDFWLWIRETKRQHIKKMVLIKEKIELSVSEFNDNLFNKIKKYIVFSVSPYKLKYKKILSSLDLVYDSNYLSYSLRKKASLMKEQLLIIDKIIEADDYDPLVYNFNKYVYLKNQIEWK